MRSSPRPDRMVRNPLWGLWSWVGWKGVNERTEWMTGVVGGESEENGDTSTTPRPSDTSGVAFLVGTYSQMVLPIRQGTPVLGR